MYIQKMKAATKYLAPNRYLPNLKNMSTFPFFNMKVDQMKAWQLYLGQSMR